MPFGLHEVLPQPATYITVMRGAVERVISAYFFMKNYVLHPNYWKFRREGWTLEDFRAAFAQRKRANQNDCRS